MPVGDSGWCTAAQDSDCLVDAVTPCTTAAICSRCSVACLRPPVPGLRRQRFRVEQLGDSGLCQRLASPSTGPLQLVAAATKVVTIAAPLSSCSYLQRRLRYPQPCRRGQARASSTPPHRRQPHVAQRHHAARLQAAAAPCEPMCEPLLRPHTASTHNSSRLPRLAFFPAQPIPVQEWPGCNAWAVQLTTAATHPHGTYAYTQRARDLGAYSQGILVDSALNLLALAPRHRLLQPSPCTSPRTALHHSCVLSSVYPLRR